MNLQKLKNEHCDAIISELNKTLKMHEKMTSIHAVEFIDKNDDAYKDHYYRSKARCCAIKQAIYIVKNVDFEFPEETKMTNDDYENAPRLATEYKFIINCPDCPNEYEANESALHNEALNQCPKCKFIWVNEP